MADGAPKHNPTPEQRARRNAYMRDYRSRHRSNLRVLFVWVPRALERDVKRIAKFEEGSVSGISAGLLRLGIERYFALADAKKVAPLRALMRDLFLNGEPDPVIDENLLPIPVKPSRPRIVVERTVLVRSSRRCQDCARAVSAAADEGKCQFEAGLSRPIRNPYLSPYRQQ